MKNKGFSFVELLVAIAILGILSLPIASSFALSAKIDAKARETYSATNAAEDVLLFVTEIDSMQEYGETIGGKIFDLEYFLSEYQTSHRMILKEKTQTENVCVYALQYEGYSVDLKTTKIDSFYRIDIVLNYSVAGDTMQITRKGVLPVA